MPSGDEQAAFEYNTVFERLVDKADGGSEVVGLIAYGIYKVSKRQWLTDFKKGSGEKPSDEHVTVFAASQTDVTLDGYKAQAQQILAAYAEGILSEERPKIIKDAVRGLFWSSVASSIVASFFFSLFLLGVAFIAALLGYGLPIQINVPKIG